MRKFRTLPRSDKLARLVSDQSGAATVEAVLWLPVFIALFALLADTALLFGSQAQTQRIAQDANRALSVGRFGTGEEAKATAEAFVRERLAPLSPGATVETVVESGLITTTVVFPGSDVVATGLVTAFADLQISVRAQHLSEN